MLEQEMVLSGELREFVGELNLAHLTELSEKTALTARELPGPVVDWMIGMFEAVKTDEFEEYFPRESLARMADDGLMLGLMRRDGRWYKKFTGKITLEETRNYVELVRISQLAVMVRLMTYEEGVMLVTNEKWQHLRKAAHSVLTYAVESLGGAERLMGIMSNASSPSVALALQKD